MHDSFHDEAIGFLQNTSSRRQTGESIIMVEDQYM